MIYSDENVYLQTKNLMDDFDVESICKIIGDQVFSTSNSYSDGAINHIVPYIKRYQDFCELEGVDETDKADIHDRYATVCRYTITAIAQRFNFEVEERWLDDNHDKLGSLAISLYNFFIIRLYYNVIELLYNYISTHKDEICEIYADFKPENDVTTKAYAKLLKPDECIIINHILSITDYAFMQIDIDTVFDYVSDSNINGQILYALYTDTATSGDFVTIIGGMYKDNIGLRSKATIELITKLTNAYNITKADMDALEEN